MWPESGNSAGTCSGPCQAISNSTSCPARHARQAGRRRRIPVAVDERVSRNSPEALSSSNRRSAKRGDALVLTGRGCVVVYETDRRMRVAREQRIHKVVLPPPRARR